MKTMRVTKSGSPSAAIALMIALGLTISSGVSGFAASLAEPTSTVHLQFQSVEGKAWIAEFKDSLGQEGWVPFAGAIGTGAAAVVMDHEPNPSSRFYRVRAMEEVFTLQTGSIIETSPGSIAGDSAPPGPPQPVTEVSPVTGPVVVNQPGGIREGGEVTTPTPVTELIPIHSVIVTYSGTITGLTVEGELQPVGTAASAVIRFTEATRMAALQSSGSGVIETSPGSIEGDPLPPGPPQPVTEVSPVAGPVVVNQPGGIREGGEVTVPTPVTELIPIHSVIVTYSGTITGRTVEEGDPEPVGATTPAGETVVVIPGAITGGMAAPAAPTPVTEVVRGQDPASR